MITILKKHVAVYAFVLLDNFWVEFFLVLSGAWVKWRVDIT
jgi:hypothetical protein